MTPGREITSLDNLSNLTFVGGELRISAFSLSNFSGFDALTTVTGNLTIENVDTATELMGFDQLTQVDGILRFNTSQTATRLSGFNGLTSVGGLDLGAYFRLTEIAGLSNLTTIDGDLWITRNNDLTTLSGLSQITEVSGQLLILENDSLPQCEAEAFRDGLTTLGGDVSIEENLGTGTCG